MNASYEQVAPPKCSTCRERERREGQRTCDECHAEYQKVWRADNRRKGEQRAYRRGFEAFRAAAVARFGVMPIKSEFNGLTAAEIVRQIPAA